MHTATTSCLAILGLLLLFGAGCADSGLSILDDELERYRFEQEKYRREDLEKCYQAEVGRSEALTRRILEIRAEIDKKEAELRDLRQRLAGIEKETAELRAEAAPAAPAEKPAPKAAK